MRGVGMYVLAQHTGTIQGTDATTVGIGLA